ncbi:MAG: hypothetical protein BWX50_01523 [Euryarchaeota archaeon ADurb.Bin009]|nr:MAG: hypothetical protein BWX50_01523 [Euryarchaeota archaeon ADurb.Bin009]
MSLPIGTWRSAIRKVFAERTIPTSNGLMAISGPKTGTKTIIPPRPRALMKAKTMTPCMTGSVMSAGIGVLGASGRAKPPGFASGRDMATRSVANAERPAMA